MDKLNKKTLTVQQLAKRHKKPLRAIVQAVNDGTKVEKEHTSSTAVAREIARDHIKELPDYYKRLRKMEK